MKNEIKIESEIQFTGGSYGWIFTAVCKRRRLGCFQIISDILLDKIMKKGLNGGSHQFHEYQQNEHSPLILTELTKHKERSWHMTSIIQILTWGRHKHVAVLNRLMGYQCSHLDNLISNSNTYINKRYEDINRFASTQSDHILSQMEWQHRCGQCNSMVNECS